MSINIPSSYGYVSMAAGVIGIVQYGVGGAVMGTRKPFSSQEFLNKPEVRNLQDLHFKAVGGTINSQGYPDMGSGRYSQHLSYEEWYKFNNAQRAHYNMVEVSGPVIGALLVSGLMFPVSAACLGFTFAVSRIVYMLGYTGSGPGGRSFGAIASTLSVFGLYGMAIYAGFKMISK